MYNYTKLIIGEREGRPACLVGEFRYYFPLREEVSTASAHFIQPSGYRTLQYPALEDSLR